MSCTIFIINKTRKEFFRTDRKDNQESLIGLYILDNIESDIHILTEESQLTDDLLYTNKYSDFKEIELY